MKLELLGELHQIAFEFVKQGLMCCVCIQESVIYLLVLVYRMDTIVFVAGLV